eukprot:TRINITY_DN12407_c0_g1_i4.p1 TRINITY_DN12407_c0_g1~~TRINITY_DN12407_c0_g1_i4.p1  ORF type:complete len:317 (-),score=35.77 TRINITY_DN12407_c0_g1_i4:135-1085(-)
MNFYNHLPLSTPVFTIGDDCFVLLPREKHTGRALVIDGPFIASREEFKPEVIQEEKSQPIKRFTIRYYHCGSTYHANELKMLRVFSRVPSVVVTRKTSEYRRLARSQVIKTDSVAELGCSYGCCTSILAEHSDLVVGLDNSSEVVASAQLHYPNINFEVFDVVRDVSKLEEKLKGFNKIFVDIGGNRTLKPLVRILYVLMEFVKPVLIVVKSEALYDIFMPTCMYGDVCAARKTQDDPYEGYIPNGNVLWKNLVRDHTEISTLSEGIAEEWFTKARANGFSQHPSHLPMRVRNQSQLGGRHDRQGGRFESSSSFRW